MAWLGWDAPPLPLQPPQGALGDQIRPGSQIRVRLTVECLRKSDGFGIEIGRRVPYTSGPLRDLQSPQYMLTIMIQIIWLGRSHSGDDSIRKLDIIVIKSEFIQ